MGAPRYHESLTDGTFDRPRAAQRPANPPRPAPVRGPSVRLATLPRKDGEELHVDLDEYNGFKFVSIRLWWKSHDGEWRPGQKGIAIKLRELDAVHEALRRAVALANGGAR